jgi:hypothetical protein
MSTDFDFRALCAELLQPLAEYDGANPYHKHRDLITRARAALAKPQPPATAPLPTGYIDPEHRGEDLKLLQAFYEACNAEGGTADEIHLRGIRAALAIDLDALAQHAAAPPAAGPWVDGIPCDFTRTLLRPAYEPGDGSADGAQLVNLAWWHPISGSDSLQIVVDNACAILARQGRLAAGPTARPDSIEPTVIEYLPADRTLVAGLDKEWPILQWTENMPPNEGCRYDHCTANTPFGRFLITWKSWKQFDSPNVDETPWCKWYGAFNSVDAAKAACQREMDVRLTFWSRTTATADRCYQHGGTV